MGVGDLAVEQNKDCENIEYLINCNENVHKMTEHFVFVEIRT